MQNIMKKIFKRDGKKKAINNSGNGGAKKFLSKISGAFMLPISVMAIAGLFLGVGATIAGHNGGSDGVRKLGLVIQNLGDPVFGNMGLLFCAAIAIAFTEEAGVAVFAAIIGFAVFNALQSIFIENVLDASGKPIPAFVDANGNITYEKVVLFSEGGRDGKSMAQLVGKNIGIVSLNTSVFGGIVVGAIVAWLYNRFHTIKLHPIVSFFGGKRFVPLITIISMLPLAFIFLVFWPWIGKGFSWFGENSGKVQGSGVDSLIFGYVERALIPFGLHHVFYAPLWWTSAGGSGVQIQNYIINHPAGTAGAIDPNDIAELQKLYTFAGDSTLWIKASGLSIDTVHYLKSDLTSTSQPLFKFLSDEVGLNLGRFMQGKFSFMILALPAAAAAMVMAAPKENRKVALGTVFPAALTSFTTGVTEPIEFTFLFLAPWLFWGFHSLMAAFSFMLMNIFGAHIGMTFSGGFLDMIIYGIIPVAKGTFFWWAFVIGAVYIPIYYFVFYYSITKFNLDTPGRGTNTKLYTKADYKEAKASSKGGLTPQSIKIVLGFGGWENILNYANCATRLRYDVKDNTKINEETLKEAGAFGVVKVSNTHYQVILGPVAEQVNTNIKSNIGKSFDKLNLNSDSASKTIVKKSTTKLNVSILAPVQGQLKPLSKIKDDAFAKGMLGSGVAIVPTDGKFYAPLSGKLTTVFPTKHAYGITTEEGVSVLIHIGLDTNKLNGKGFKSKVKQGQDIKAGDLLVEVDLDFVKKEVTSIDTPIVITPESSGSVKVLKTSGKVSLTDRILEVK